MDLLDYFRVLRRRWKLIVALVVAGVVIGAGSTLLSSGSSASSGRREKATHTLVFDSSISNASSSSGSSSSSATQSPSPTFKNLDQIAVLVTTGDVPSRVGKKLNEDPRQITNRITTKSNSTTNTLDITAIGTSSNAAERLADTTADELVASLNEKERTRFDKSSRDTITRLDKLRGDIANLDAQVAARTVPMFRVPSGMAWSTSTALRTNASSNSPHKAPLPAVSPLFETASAVPISTGTYNALLEQGEIGENNTSVDAQGNVSQSPPAASSPPTFEGPVSRGLLGGFIGLLLGVGLALVAERFDRRVRTREEVEAAFGVPVLAEVPRLTPAQQRSSEVVTQTAPLSLAAEAYRGVRSSLLFQAAHPGVGRANDDGGIGGNGSGASTPGAAEREALVIMVTSPAPGDGKTTTSVNVAAAFAETGASVLVINCDFRRPKAHKFLRVPDEPQRTLKTPISGVHYVSSVVAEGAANPAQIVAAQRKVIASAREHFDVIVLDTAPLLLANDAVQVVGCADSVLLVARFESTTIDRAQRAMELLSRVEAPVAGVVLVATPEESGGYYYYSSQRDAAPSRSAEHVGVTGAPVRGGDGAVPNGLPSDPVDQPDPLG